LATAGEQYLLWYVFEENLCVSKWWNLDRSEKYHMSTGIGIALIELGIVLAVVGDLLDN